MTTLTPSISRSIPLDAAATLTGVLALFLLGKLTSALGAALSLDNACWQLLALRAGSAALVVGVLAHLNRDRLWLFGLAYAAVLSVSHLSVPILIGATAAGLVASLLRHYRFGPALPTLAFVLTLALPGLIKKLAATPALPLPTLALDLAIRTTAAATVLLALYLLAPLAKRTANA